MACSLVVVGLLGGSAMAETAASPPALGSSEKTQDAPKAAPAAKPAKSKHKAKKKARKAKTKAKHHRAKAEKAKPPKQ
jgi:hypothetical protein